MKKYLVSFLLILLSVSASAQQLYPSPNQKLGSKGIMVEGAGGFKIDSTLLVPRYNDTCGANTCSSALYAGSVISSGNSLWLRNATATEWLQTVNSGGGSSAQNTVWYTAGNNFSAALINPFLGTIDLSDLVIKNNNITTAIFNAGGMTHNNGNSLVVVVQDSLTKRLYHVPLAFGSGTVTSVAFTAPTTLFTVSGSPITSSGTFTTTLTNATGGTLWGNNGSSSAAPSYTAVPVLGVAGTTKGSIGLAGNTSGIVTISPQAAAGTYNFNLPTTAGTSGQFLTSGGGGSSPNTWTSIGSVGWTILGNSGTGVSNFLGTTDDVSLKFRVNNTHAGFIGTFSGGENLSIGESSLPLATTGTGNAVFGHEAMQSNTTGTNNTAVGTGALGANTAGGNSTAVGYQALNVSLGNNNTSVGNQSFRLNTTGTQNSSIGKGSFSAVTTGSDNSGIGYFIGQSLVTGNRNTLLGSGTDVAAASTRSSVGLGYGATPTNNELYISDSIFSWKGKGFLSTARDTTNNKLVVYNPSTGVYKYSYYPTAATFALTNGSGTTANGTAVDFGGTLTAPAVIDGNGNMNGVTIQNNSAFQVFTSPIETTILSPTIVDDDVYSCRDNPAFVYNFDYAGSTSATAQLRGASACNGRMYRILRTSTTATGVLTITTESADGLIQDKTGAFNASYTLLPLDKIEWQSDGQNYIMSMHN